MNESPRRIVVAAGGTGGHVFPALAVAGQLRKMDPNVEITWYATERGRAPELCRRHGIPVEQVRVKGIDRLLSPRTLGALGHFVGEMRRLREGLRRLRPDAVVAFGGYVAAPAVCAALLERIPYFLCEPNTVPGRVTRFFSRWAVCTFLGFPLDRAWRLRGATEITGVPVRPVEETYDGFPYPEGLDRSKRVILVCGGSQGAQSMNRLLVGPVRHWIAQGRQVVWQTGAPGYDEIACHFGGNPSVFLFAGVDDLYPYYALARVVVGRAGASTLAEVAYFGLPVVAIPLPWSTDGHQWKNAGLTEIQGWGVRVKQEEKASEKIRTVVDTIYEDQCTFEAMSGKAIDASPASAAGKIAGRVLSRVKS